MSPELLKLYNDGWMLHRLAVMNTVYQCMSDSKWLSTSDEIKPCVSVCVKSS